MGIYFGTDGIRGVAGAELDAELAFKTGCAAAAVLKMSDAARPRVLIARDTRVSCDMLESALASGLCSVGVDVALLGVLATPAAAYLTIKTEADMGIVISASHNTFEHNGIKIFGKDGYKLSDALEDNIEALITDNSGIRRMTHGNIGRITYDHGFWTGEYVKYLAAASRGKYNGRIAIDCSNGAAAETARLLFRKLGAEFEVFHDEPNGININTECGSTHIGFLQDMMKTGRFGIGIAFDGDADRCLIVDECGQVVDGDMMLAVFARFMKDSGTLSSDAFVGTVVSNSGLDVFARENGFTLHRAAVGDRNVLEMMLEIGCNLGGESSGHVLFTDDATTGDGQLTAIKFLNALAASGKTVSELVRDIPRYPQVMPGFKLECAAAGKDAIMSHPKLIEGIKTVEDRLSGMGRVLIRPSGTEPVIRVLVEAETERLAEENADYLIKIMQSLG